MHTPQFVLFPLNGYFHCFWVRAIINKVAVYVLLHYFMDVLSITLESTPKSRFPKCSYNLHSSESPSAWLGVLSLSHSSGIQSYANICIFPMTSDAEQCFQVLIVQSHIFEVSIQTFAQFNYLSFLLSCRSESFI